MPGNFVCWFACDNFHHTKLIGRSGEGVLGSFRDNFSTFFSSCLMISCNNLNALLMLVLMTLTYFQGPSSVFKGESEICL